MTNIKKYNQFIAKFKPFEVNEGLIRTQAPGVLLSGFHRLMNYNGSNAIIDYDDNGILYVICKDINKNDASFILSLIGNYGYFVSEYIMNDIVNKFDEKTFLEINFYNKEKIDVILYIEAKFDTNVKNIPNILYHATLTQYVEAILENGLYPKTKNKITTHPPRIYLANNLNNAIIFARLAKAKHFKEMTILEIDTTKIKPTTSFNGESIPFKIYNDPNYKKKGFYTLNNIPKEAIKETKNKI